MRQSSRPLGSLPFDPDDNLNRAIADRRVRIEYCERVLRTRVNARVIADKQYHELALRELEAERDRRQTAAKGPPIATKVTGAAPRRSACKKEPKNLPHDYRKKEDETAALFRAMSQPTDKQLTCLTLNCQYGWSATEIGTHLGMHRKTVDGHVVAAKKKLRPVTKERGAASDK